MCMYMYIVHPLSLFLFLFLSFSFSLSLSLSFSLSLSLPLSLSLSLSLSLVSAAIDTAFTEGGELTDQLAFIGLPFVMHCSATGAPPPTYTWYKSGVPLSESETLSFPDGTLTILDVTDSHAGLYTCEAQNMLPETGVVIHTVSSSAELTVIGEYNIL